MSARYLCCCCGASFTDPRPQNFFRDAGYGTCARCREWLKSRPQDRDEPATARSMLDERYA